MLDTLRTIVEDLPTMSLAARAVYILRSEAPSLRNDAIARLLGISRRTLFRAYRELELAGLYTRERTVNRTAIRHPVIQ